MGNEASKDGSGFPSPLFYTSSSNKKRSRVSELVEGGLAVVEMTSIIGWVPAAKMARAIITVPTALQLRC